MSYEFKKIADLERVTEVPEGATVLIETEGATKRLSSTAIRGSVDVVAEVGQTIVVKSVDENGKPTEWEAVDMKEPVQADWSQLDETQPDFIKNRTHGYELRHDIAGVYKDGKISAKVDFNALVEAYNQHNVCECVVNIPYLGNTSGTCELRFSEAASRACINITMNAGSFVFEGAAFSNTTELNMSCENSIGMGFSDGDAFIFQIEDFEQAILKQIEERYIPDTIQRVGEPVYLRSYTTSKTFCLDVDSNGTVIATEVT